MAYTGLTVTYNGTKAAETDGTLNSSFIPAYPEITSSTTVNEAFYWARQQQCDKLIEDTTVWYES